MAVVVPNIKRTYPTSKPHVFYYITSSEIHQLSILLFVPFQDSLKYSYWFSKFFFCLFFWLLALFFGVCSPDRSFFSILNFFSTLLPHIELFMEGESLVVFQTHQTPRLQIVFVFIFQLHTHPLLLKILLGYDMIWYQKY